MRGQDQLAILLTIAVIALDQISKWIVDAAMGLHTTVEIIPGLLNLTYVRNTGAAFGLLSSPEPGIRSVLLLVFSLLAVGAILVMWVKSREARRLFFAALGLILGGALGNLIDRFRLGEVIDFIDLHWEDLHWPAFNLADSAITVGVALLIFHLLRSPETPSAQ